MGGGTYKIVIAEKYNLRKALYKRKSWNSKVMILKDSNFDVNFKKYFGNGCRKLNKEPLAQ